MDILIRASKKCTGRVTTDQPRLASLVPITITRVVVMTLLSPAVATLPVESIGYDFIARI